MSGRQAKRERADARDAYVRQFFLAYIRRLRGILKRLGPTAEPLQDGSCVLARIHLKPAIESGLDAVVKARADAEDVSISELVTRILTAAMDRDRERYSTREE